MLNFYALATFLMLVALTYQIVKFVKVSAISLTVLLSFITFWFSYLMIDDPRQFYVIECFRSSTICLIMYYAFTVTKQQAATPFLIYSFVLVSQTFINLLQLFVNISGYTDPIYTALSLIEIALFIYGYLHLQRQYNGDDNNNCIDSGCSARSAWICNYTINEKAKK